MIYWKFKYLRTQRALAVGVSAAIKNNPIVACDFSFTFDESGANTGIEDKIAELIKAGF